MVRLVKIRRMAVFVEHFPPFLGSDRTVFELTKRVAEKGVKVHFVATQPLRYLVGERPDDWSYKDNWVGPPPKVHPNVTCEYLLLSRYLEAMWRRFPPIAYLITLMLFTLRGIHAVLKHQADIVVAAHASPIVGVVSLLSAKMSLRPLMMGCPDWMAAYAASLVEESLSSLGPVLLQLAENLLYQLSNRVFAATHFLKRLLVGYGIPSEKIVVISNGVDVDMFRPDVPAAKIDEKYRLGDRCIVLFTGHLEEWAGVSAIYDLAKRLDKDYPESLILLVGAGDPSTGLLKRLIRDNLGHMFVHAGLHPFEQMPMFTGAADISLCIFPDTPVSHAASPLKLFEYMAAGNAVVATRVAGTAEVLDDSTGVLVPPGEIDQICDAVVELCKDGEKRQRLGEKARERVVTEYSWRKLSDEFLSQCERISRGPIVPPPSSDNILP
jgi:glycosyltransferase involved in cell wall biosynthesis